jgi:RHS repeat-associated protein
MPDWQVALPPDVVAALPAFHYGPDRARYKKTIGTRQGADETTLYVGKAYERIQKGTGEVLHKHFVYADGQLAAVHVDTEVNGVVQARDDSRYFHRDALGSIDTITDARGQVIDRMAYTPFGEARPVMPRFIDQPTLATFNNRGFTGHEQLDDIGLIHMNGRVYDPKLGRFLSADPHVQAPNNSQSYNRYSYVVNNPLKYADPSGYFFKKLFKAVKKLLKNPIFQMVAAIAFAAFAGPAVFWHLAATTSMSITAAAVVSGAMVGFGAGLIGSGGDIRAGLIGGFVGGLSGYIGASPVFGDVGRITVKRVIAHGTVGGASSELSGGKFASGFVSSAFSKSLSGQIASITEKDPVAGAVTAAVVGGTASEVAGGRFANGALTNSFQYLFNEWSSGQTRKSTSSLIQSELSSWWKDAVEQQISDFQGLPDDRALSVSLAVGYHYGLFGEITLANDGIYAFSGAGTVYGAHFDVGATYESSVPIQGFNARSAGTVCFLLCASGGVATNDEGLGASWSLPARVGMGSSGYIVIGVTRRLVEFR